MSSRGRPPQRKIPKHVREENLQPRRQSEDYHGPLLRITQTIAPGVVGGLIANDVGAGFLGVLAAGLLAGTIVMLLKKIKIPGAFGRLMPILVYPIAGCLAVGTLMIVVVGQPIAGVTTGLENWIGGLEGTNGVLPGIILGAMMAFDMGGPVNKAAYAFAIAGLAGGAFGPMAAVMAAGMVPPLALATAVRGKAFTPAEQRAGQAGPGGARVSRVRSVGG